MLRGMRSRVPSNALRRAIQRTTATSLSRHFSSTELPDGWERIVRKNGDIAYYNVALRKTVRNLPGMSPPAESSDVTSSSNAAPDLSRSPPKWEHLQTEPNEDPNEVTVPIEFDAAMTIEGHESQIVHIDLLPQQCLRAETGGMIYMTDGVDMETTTAGGFQQGLKRIVTGENFFVSCFTYRGPTKGRIGLGTSFPSKILRLRLSDFIGQAIICQKGAFLCGADTINIEMEFARSFGVGFFGGEGFVLQRLTGTGDALVRASGAVIERDLEPGEVLRISSGCLVAFEPSVQYDITTMKGVKNVLFGGEGLFITTLTGPGKVILQSLPFERMVGEVVSRIPGSGSHGMMAAPFIMGSGGNSESDGDASATGDAPPSGTHTPEDEAMSDASTSSAWSSDNDTDSSIYGAAENTESPSSSSSEWNESGELLDESLDDTVESATGVMDFFKRVFGE